MALLLSGCEKPPQDDARQNVPALGANGRRDLTGTKAVLAGQKAGLSYAAYDRLRDQEGAGLAFASYGCMTDCADVIRGYRRASQAGIRSADLCTGATWGEVEGCVAFTQGFDSSLSNVLPLR